MEVDEAADKRAREATSTLNSGAYHFGPGDGDNLLIGHGLFPWRSAGDAWSLGLGER